MVYIISMNDKNKKIVFRRPSPYAMTTVNWKTGIPKKPFPAVEYEEVKLDRESTDKLLELAAKGLLNGR